MRSIMFTVLAPVLLLARICHGSELCDLLLENRVGSEEDYKDKVGPWVQKEYSTWNMTKGYEKTPNHFWNYLHQKFAPTLADSIISCNLSSTCSTVSCKMIVDDISIEEQMNAFRTMESVSNFHNQRYDTRELISENFASALADKNTMIQTFSDGPNIKRADVKHQAHEKMMFHIMLAVTQVATSTLGVVTGSNGIMLAGEAVAGTAAKGFMTKQTQAVMTIVQTTFQTGANLDVSYSNIMYDLQSADNYNEKITADVSHMMAANEQMAQDMFAVEMYETLRGGRNIAGQTLADIVESGQYREEIPRTPMFEKMNRDLVVASWIANLWNTERAYIAWSDTEGGGSCEGDNRGPPELKVCLPDYPGSVFHVYFISRILEGAGSKFKQVMKDMKGEALVRGPPGHEKLGHGEYANITLSDVVQASLAHYEDHGNMPAEKIVGQEGIDNYFSPHSSLVQRGGLYRGIFSVPVCYESRGLGISSINLKASRSYPCMCATPPFPKRNGGRQSLFERQENATAEASTDTLETNTTVEKSLVKRKEHHHHHKDHSKYAEDHDPVETEKFLSATGLFISGNWYDFCVAKKHHDCYKDHSFTFNFPQYGGKRTTLTYPFRSCKLSEHVRQGCQTPKNDGQHENKDC